MIAGESGRNQTRILNQDPARLRRRRVAAGLDQQSLAGAANVAKSHLSMVERGKANASPAILGRLAAVLGCQIADLMAAEPTGEARDEVSEDSLTGEPSMAPVRRSA